MVGHVGFFFVLEYGDFIMSDTTVLEQTRTYRVVGVCADGSHHFLSLNQHCREFSTDRPECDHDLADTLSLSGRHRALSESPEMADTAQCD